MTNRSDVVVVQVSAADINLGTLRPTDNTQPAQPTVVVSTKDSGRVHIGGGSIRF